MGNDRFKLGDRVEAIDELVIGTVIKIAPNQITIESVEGFELVFAPAELMPAPGVGDFKVSHYDVARIKDEKELSKRRSYHAPKKREAYTPVMEVDLHINQLVPSSKGMGNYEILNLQLDVAKRQLEFAMGKKIQKIVFIHGVGEGVLKEELHYFFKKYGNVKFYDANYQKYGLGATEVYIYQNP